MITNIRRMSTSPNSWIARTDIDTLVQVTPTTHSVGAINHDATEVVQSKARPEYPFRNIEAQLEGKPLSHERKIFIL